MKLISLLVCLLFCLNSFSQKTPNQMRVVPLNYVMVKEAGLVDPLLINKWPNDGKSRIINYESLNESHARYGNNTKFCPLPRPE